MAFPQTAAPTVSTIENVTSHPVAMPATVNSGDLLIIFFGSQTRAVTPASGWTLLSTAANGYELNVFYKIAAGTEGGTSPAFTTDSGANSSHQVYRITSWHGTTPPEAGTTVTGTSTTPDPPNLTPSWGAADTLWFAASNGGFNGSPTISDYPDNYTNGTATVSSGGFQVSLLGSCRRELNATSDNPNTFTISGTAEWVAQTVAVRPVADSSVNGTLAVIQAPHTSTASGTTINPIIGTVAVTQADQVGNAVGSFPVSGTSSTFQASQTSTAVGTVGVAVTGTLAVTQASQTSTAVGGTGTGTITGTLAYTQEGQFSASAGATWSAAGGIPGQAIDGGLRFEAFQLPDLGFARKFDLTRWISGFTVAEKWDQISDAAFSLKSDFPRLADFMTVDAADHSNDVGSIVRVLRGQTPVMHYMCKQRDDTWSADSNVIPCHLEGMEYFMDKATVPRYDYPAKPSLDPDHIYGAKSILRTIGGEFTNEVQEIDTDATSGSFTLTYSGQTTVPIPFNATAIQVADALNDLGWQAIWRDAGVNSGTFILDFLGQQTSALAWNVSAGSMATALEALSNVVDVDVSGTGSIADPWLVRFLDPAGNQSLMTVPTSTLNGNLFITATVVNVDVSGGGDPLNPWTFTFIDTENVAQIVANIGTLNAPINVSTIREGGTLSPRPWHGSFNPVTQLTHGTYDLFEIVTTPVPAGDTYALAIDGGDPVFAGDYSGCQLIVEVTPGRTYRASIPVRANSGTEVFRFVIRDMSENLIAATPDTTIGTTYTTMNIPTLKIPAGVTQIIYRVGIIDAGNPGKVFVGIESALLAPGQEAAPFGKIMWDLFDLVQAAGRLTWLVPTFTDTHDSDGNLWDRDLEWAVKRRQSLWQLCEYAKRWFYLNRLDWNDAAGVFNWNAYNPNGGGTNYQGTGLAISGRTGVTSSGVISHRAPEATYYDAEGDGGQWGEFEDATLTGAWGPLDKYYPNRQGLDSAGLDILAERLVDDATSRTEGIVIRLEAPTALPWDRFRPGDLVTINLGPKMPKQLMRCMAVVASQGPDDSHPAYDTHWGSVVYQGEAATAHMLRTLWRKFETLDMFDAPATIDPAGAGCCPSCMAHARPTIVITSTSSTIVGTFDWIIDGDTDGLLALTAGGDLVIAKPGLYTVDFGFRFGVTFTAAGVAPIHFTASVDGNDAPNWEGTYTAVSSGAFGVLVKVHGRFWAHTENVDKQINFDWEVDENHTYPTTNLISKVSLPTLSPGGFTPYKELAIVRHSPGCAQERSCS